VYSYINEANVNESPEGENKMTYTLFITSSIHNNRVTTFGSISAIKDCVKAYKSGANEYVTGIYVDVTTPVGDTDNIYTARRNEGCKNFKVTNNLLAKYTKEEKEGL